MSHPCLYHDVLHLHTFDDKTVRILSSVQICLKQRRLVHCTNRLKSIRVADTSLRIIANSQNQLHNSLLEHSLCHLHKACYIGTLDVVYIAILLCAILNASGVDGLHDIVEFAIDLGS